MGYLPNSTKVFSLHPGAFQAWRQLVGVVGGGTDLRRELATLGADRQLRSSYCSLAHGKIPGLGLGDRDTCDLILATAARCFFSKVLDPGGALPDRAYMDLEPDLRDA